MTLSFTTEINGKPTYFVEKIWEAIMQKGIQVNLNEFAEYGKKYLSEGYKLKTNKPKIHTIRRDLKNRWKVGNKIHFVINNRTKDRQQFAPIMKVKSIQKIKIEWIPHVNMYHGEEKDLPIIHIDGVKLERYDFYKLFENDGFEGYKDFFEWFNEDFEGIIIHWTDFKY